MKLVDDVITIPDQAVAQSVAEPTGALALAVALSEEFNQKYPASVCSSKNG